MRRNVVLLLAAALAAPLATAAPALAQAGPRIGIFDAQRISEETAEGKRVQAVLAAFRDRKQAELQGKEKEVADLRKQLQDQGLSLSAEKRATLEKDIQRRTLELQQSQEGASKEFQLELQEAQGRFQEQLLAVIDQFAQAEGFQVLFERGQVAWAGPGVDVTTAIVDRFNQMVPAQGAAAPPAGGSDPAAPPKK